MALALSKGPLMKQKKAVILDDDPVFQLLMKDLVESVGYKVMTFSDPTVFLRQIQDSCYCKESSSCVDLIVTDNQMPNMTGLEFLKMLKSKGCKLADVKKSIISGTWSKEELSLAEKLKCKVFHKSAPTQELQQWLTNF